MAATLADGRVVISWTDESNILGTNHETRAQLLDPRLAGVTVTGTAGADKYVGSAFADVLKGEGGDDALRGGAGDDTLDGGSGADSMEGGTGNDTYVVDNAGDTVIEQAGEGTDTVKASIAYTLGANVENLTLMEPAAIAASGNVDATGNSLANTLTGNS
ncbi:MAG: Ig family protein, partial [Gammaproteobacteria bacterium]|nr:Ig family protein [Gammaproteobacteria bacterium]